MKQYTLDGSLLTETPEIRIGDRIYKVDNRMSTVKKAAAALKDNPDNEYDITIKMALGEKAYEEIMELDLSISAAQELMAIITAAINGITVEEAKARFQNK